MLSYLFFGSCQIVALYILTVTGDCNLPTPSFVGNAIPSNYDESFAVGFELQYECKSGFVKDGVIDGTTRTCLNNGSWTDLGFDCVRLDCGLPVTPRHGNATYTRTTFGAIVVFSCDEGYILDGSNRAVCRLKGENVEWGESSPTCNAVVCPSPVAPINGRVDDGDVSDYVFGTVITYVCDSGYKLLAGASSTVDCNAEGSWGEVPTCDVDYDCTFEKSADRSCGYTNTGSWERKLYKSSGNGGLGYAYLIQGTGGGSLTSPAFSADARGACLSFSYRITSSNSAQLLVSVQRENGSDAETAVFTAGPASTSGFVQEEIDLSRFTESIVWRYSVTAPASAIAVDEVALRRSSCQALTTGTSSTRIPGSTSGTTERTMTDCGSDPSCQPNNSKQVIITVVCVVVLFIVVIIAVLLWRHFKHHKANGEPKFSKVLPPDAGEGVYAEVEETTSLNL